MRLRSISLAFVTTTALALVGCGQAGESGQPTSSGTATPIPTVSSPAPLTEAPPDPSASVPPADPGKPTKPALPGGPDAGTQTITGTVVAGVEPGCLVLDAGGTSYLLVFSGDRARVAAPKAGAKVTVVGTPSPDMVTTCQQGTPLVVSEVRPS